MPTTKDQQAQDNADFAQQFAKDDVPKAPKTDEEEFGLDAQGAADAGEAAPAPTAAGDSPAAASAPADAEQQRLQEWDAQLKAKEAELADRELASATSSVQKTETGTKEASPADAPSEGDEDPAAALAEDFGPEFVSLITRLIENTCKKHVGEGVGSVSATVESLIHDLRAERESNHFNRIRAAHEDFEELTQGPEFSAWKEAQPAQSQANLQRVIDSGSADEIITMLTTFKNDKPSGDGANAELDAAEGVRSSALKLPDEPKNDTSYLDAWNNA